MKADEDKSRRKAAERDPGSMSRDAALKKATVIDESDPIAEAAKERVSCLFMDQ